MFGLAFIFATMAAWTALSIVDAVVCALWVCYAKNDDLLKKNHPALWGSWNQALQQAKQNPDLPFCCWFVV